MSDTIELLINQWAKERPDISAKPMAVVGRVLRLAGVLQSRAEQALKPYNLTLWQFDVLATLRRFGEPFRMSPKQLMHQAMLSSGAMTNRIDRLEQKKYVRRLPDPNDRRGVLIELTPKGRDIIDKAIAARFVEAQEVTDLLNAHDQKQLAVALKTLLANLEPQQD